MKAIYGHLMDWEDMGIRIYMLTEYQYRFIKDKHIIDYYPTSGKYHDVTFRYWGRCYAFKINKLFR